LFGFAATQGIRLVNTLVTRFGTEHVRRRWRWH
jgi:hypothetical protein